MKKFKVPEFGISIIEGVPGSGKSFKMVEDVLHFTLKERRPVYTNLPLKLPVFRKYLRDRGGEAAANLIVPLTEAHFRGFLGVSKKVAELKAEHSDMLREWNRRRSLGHVEDRPQSFKRWRVSRLPELIDRGPGANWIPPAAVVMIDEVHHWFRGERKRFDEPELLAYCTMLRHHMHLLIVSSQDRDQINITFRTLCDSFWAVRNRQHDQVKWGITLGMLGFRGFGYSRFTQAQDATREKYNTAPAHSFTRYYWLPWHKWKFRLYDSFTHTDSARGMARALERARMEAGVGEFKGLHETKKKGKAKMRTLVLVGALACGLGYVAGRSVKPVTDAVLQVAEPKASFEVKTIGDDFVVTKDGKFLEKGGTDAVALLDVLGGSAFMRELDGVYLVRGPGRAPEYLGSVSEFRARLYQVVANGRAEARRMAPAPATPGSPN